MDWIPYVLIGIILLYLALQFGFWFAPRRLKGRPAPDVSDLLRDRSLPQGKLLFYFYSSSCGPCRIMGPRVDRLSEGRSNVIKVNIGEDYDLACRFGISVVPSILLVDEGKIRKVLVGRQSRRRLEALLD